MPKKKNKSDDYQYKIVEIVVDSNTIGDFPLIEGLGSQMNLAKFSEEFNKLRKELMSEVRKIINNNLTDKQKNVVLLTLQGKTQIQIAEELGVHQTTVHKTICGNWDYRKEKKKKYGGAITKLRKICKKTPRVQEILEQMDELKSQSPFGEEQWMFGYDVFFGDED